MTDTSVRVTTERTKRFTVQACVQLMRRAGCIVTSRPTDLGVTIDVTIPADTTDIHSARYLALRDDETRT